LLIAVILLVFLLFSIFATAPMDEALMKTIPSGLALGLRDDTPKVLLKNSESW
jgi:hypothetical protein